MDSIDLPQSKPFVPVAWSWLALLLVAGCHRDDVRLDDRIGTETAARDSSAERARPLDARAEAAAPDARRGSLAMAPIVDRDRGSRAVKGYLRFLAAFCQSFEDAGGRAAKLAHDVGLPFNGDESPCPGVLEAVTALASGSFVELGADEVLLDVPSGQDEAAGGRTLALMRATGGDYRLIYHMLAGNQFEARRRLVVPGAVDVLILCRGTGRQGAYRSVCGFFGQGSFRDADETEDANELELVALVTCGPSSWVGLGDIDLDHGRLSVGLVLTRALRKPNGPDEAPDGLCSKVTHAKESRFTVKYEVEAHGATRPGEPRVRRVTPIPHEVTDLATRF